jgi:TrmH family RNA methyltransferase
MKKLTQKKYRQEQQHFLLEGEHLVLELFKAAVFKPYLLKTQLFVTEAYAQWLHAHNKLNMRFTLVGQKAMAQLCDTATPQGIVAAVPFAPEDKNRDSLANTERAVYLHEVQDPGNLGTILRTLAWFGGFRLLLSPNSVDPYHPKVVRASMGAIFHVPFELDMNLIEVQERFPRMAYLDMDGKSLSENSFKNYDCYIFGNEARGVPKDELEEVRATAFTIKGSGLIESLNLASAVNMCVYELRRG